MLEVADCQVKITFFFSFRKNHASQNNRNTLLVTYSSLHTVPFVFIFSYLLFIWARNSIYKQGRGSYVYSSMEKQCVDPSSLLIHSVDFDT